MGECHSRPPQTCCTPTTNLHSSLRRYKIPVYTLFDWAFLYSLFFIWSHSFYFIYWMNHCFGRRVKDKLMPFFLLYTLIFEEGLKSHWWNRRFLFKSTLRKFQQQNNIKHKSPSSLCLCKHPVVLWARWIPECARSFQHQHQSPLS